MGRRGASHSMSLTNLSQVSTYACAGLGVSAGVFSNAAVIFGPFVTDKMIFGFCADLLNPTLQEAERCEISPLI